jgi:O-antigen/teichoic acid export membrane protein
LSLKKNIVANYLGQGWSAFMGLAFVPIYIKILGIEAYGLIGFFTMLQVWLLFLDMGMTPTLNREIARYKAGASNKEFVLDLLRTFECMFLIVSVMIFGLIFFGAPFLCKIWLNVRNLPDDEVVQAISVMGLVVIARLWEDLYRSAILGMQQQQWLSFVQAFLSTLRWGGAAIVLFFLSPTIKAFFLWQGFVSLISILIE